MKLFMVFCISCMLCIHYIWVDTCIHPNLCTHAPIHRTPNSRPPESGITLAPLHNFLELELWTLGYNPCSQPIRCLILGVSLHPNLNVGCRGINNKLAWLTILHAQTNSLSFARKLKDSKNETFKRCLISTKIILVHNLNFRPLCTSLALNQ